VQAVGKGNGCWMMDDGWGDGRGKRDWVCKRRMQRTMVEENEERANGMVKMVDA